MGYSRRIHRGPTSNSSVDAADSMVVSADTFSELCYE